MRSPFGMTVTLGALLQVFAILMVGLSHIGDNYKCIEWSPDHTRCWDHEYGNFGHYSVMQVGNIIWALAQLVPFTIAMHFNVPLQSISFVKTKACYNRTYWLITIVYTTVAAICFFVLLSIRPEKEDDYAWYLESETRLYFAKILQF